MKPPTGAAYYLAQKGKLLKNHDKLMTLGAEIIQNRYGTAAAHTILEESRLAFAKLIPHIPYIGGKENAFTDTLVQLTSFLALYQVMKQQGKPAAEAGDLAYEMSTAWINRYPRWLRHLIGRFYMSSLWQRRTQKRATQSQMRQYPGDFVYEVVPGDGQQVVWGVNYLACGVVKFFHEQGADEFAPYMCRIDHLLFPAMGIRLQRQGTIAQGCTHCDFRYSWGKKSSKVVSG